MIFVLAGLGSPNLCWFANTLYYGNIFMIHQLSHLLQVLGAFGLLTKRKGNPQFADYIPTALATPQIHLSRVFHFPRLRGLIERLLQAFT